MRNAILLLVLTLLFGCSTIRQYDYVKIWAGIQAPIPLYPINIGLNLELKNEVAIAAESKKKKSFLDGMAEIISNRRKKNVQKVISDRFNQP